MNVNPLGKVVSAEVIYACAVVFSGTAQTRRSFPADSRLAQENRLFTTKYLMPDLVANWVSIRLRPHNLCRSHKWYYRSSKNSLVTVIVVCAFCCTLQKNHSHALHLHDFYYNSNTNLQAYKNFWQLNNVVLQHYTHGVPDNRSNEILAKNGIVVNIIFKYWYKNLCQYLYVSISIKIVNQNYLDDNIWGVA